MADLSLEEARSMLEVVIGPEEVVSKVPEFQFSNVEALLKANQLSRIPPLPPRDLCEEAKEQHKALIFRIGRDGTGQSIDLVYLKEHFGSLIYSSWYKTPLEPFAQEPVPTGWALADLDPLPGSEDKTFEEQKKFAEGIGARLKSAVADVYDLVIAQKVTGKFFRGEPLNARTATEVHRSIVKISHFNKTSGMAISYAWGPTVKSADIGVATELVWG